MAEKKVVQKSYLLRFVMDETNSVWQIRLENTKTDPNPLYFADMDSLSTFFVSESRSLSASIVTNQETPCG